LSQKATLLLAVCAVLARPVWAQNGAPKATGLSDAEKLEKSAEQVARMKADLRAVLTRVEEAWAEKDVVKLNCVNEKLTQVKGLLKVAEQADVALHEAVANRDPGADAEYSKIAIARSKIGVLKGEADQCIGQLAYVVDERTTVEVQQPDGLPGQDVTRRRPPDSPGFSAPPPIVRPPPASKYH